MTDRVYNVGTGTSTSLAELAGALARAMGSEVVPEHTDSRPHVAVAHRRAAVERARTELGFTASIALDEGLADYSCIRCNIHGTAKGAKADQDVTVQDSYLHGLSYDGSTHTENFFYDGGAGNITVKHNWMKANPQYSTGAVSLNNDWPGHYATIDSNYLEGNGGADVTGGAMGKANPNMDHIVVTNNKLSPNNSWGAAGGYGYDPSAPGNVWTNNTNAVTGAVVAAPSPL